MSATTPWRLSAALVLSAALAAAALWRTARDLPDARSGRADPLDQTRARFGQLRADLPRRAGYVFDLGPFTPGDPRQYTSFRVERLFQAQHAVAPVVLVAVLGQPQNGVLEPPESDRRAALARVDVVLVEGPSRSPAWHEATRAGFRLDRIVDGVALFRRWAP